MTQRTREFFVLDAGNMSHITACPVYPLHTMVTLGPVFIVPFLLCHHSRRIKATYGTAFIIGFRCRVGKCTVWSWSWRIPGMALSSYPGTLKTVAPYGTRGRGIFSVAEVALIFLGCGKNPAWWSPGEGSFGFGFALLVVGWLLTLCGISCRLRTKLAKHVYIDIYIW